MARTLFGFLLVLMVSAASGCNAVAILTTAAAPPEKVNAKFDLPDKPTLVVIDDWDGLVNNETQMRRIALSVRAALEAENVVTKGFVGQDELAAIREELGPSYRQTSLALLGAKLGARQVISAQVVGYQMSTAGSVIRPTITLHVKVVDVDERARVFPPLIDRDTGVDSGAKVFPVVSRMKMRDTAGQSAARSIAARDLADQAGRDIGRLFFDWRKRKPGTNMESER